MSTFGAAVLLLALGICLFISGASIEIPPAMWAGIALIVFSLLVFRAANKEKEQRRQALEELEKLSFSDSNPFGKFPANDAVTDSYLDKKDIDFSFTNSSTIKTNLKSTHNADNIKYPFVAEVAQSRPNPANEAFRMLHLAFTSISKGLRCPLTSCEREKFDKWLSKRKLNLDTMLNIFLHCLDSKTTVPLLDLFSQCEYRYGKVSNNERIFLSSVYLFKPTGPLVIPDNYVKNFITNVLISNHSKDTKEYTIAKNRVIYLIKEFGSYENLKKQLMQNFEKLKEANIEVFVKLLYNPINKVLEDNSELILVILENLEDFVYIEVFSKEIIGEAFAEVKTHFICNYFSEDDTGEELAEDEDYDSMSDLFGDLDSIDNVDEAWGENLLDKNTTDTIANPSDKKSTIQINLRREEDGQSQLKTKSNNIKKSKNANTHSVKYPTDLFNKILPKEAKTMTTKIFSGNNNFLYHCRCLAIAYFDLLIFNKIELQYRIDFLNIATLDVSNDFNLSINFINNQICYYGLKLSKNLDYEDIATMLASAISEDSITPINDQTPLEILDIITLLDYVAKIASLHREIALFLKKLFT